MSSFVSRLPEIIDQSAAVAALVPGIKSVQGCGSGLVDDPLRPGQKIAVLTSNPVSDYTHVTYPPSAARFDWGMIGMVTVAWTLVMRTIYSKGDIAASVKALNNFYAGYITAFSQHLQLHGTCREAYLTGGRQVVVDDSWAAIEWTLTATERLNLATAA